MVKLPSSSIVMSLFWIALFNNNFNAKFLIK